MGGIASIDEPIEEVDAANTKLTRPRASCFVCFSKGKLLSGIPRAKGSWIIRSKFGEGSMDELQQDCLLETCVMIGRNLNRKLTRMQLLSLLLVQEF